MCDEAVLSTGLCRNFGSESAGYSSSMMSALISVFAEHQIRATIVVARERDNDLAALDYRSLRKRAL